MGDNSVDSLKQRLVGAFVILSLAIIFLPMVFDKPHSVGSSSIVPVPQAPEVKAVVIKKPEKPTFSKLEVDPIDNKVKEVKRVEAKVSPESRSTANPSSVDASKVNASKTTAVASGPKATKTVVAKTPSVNTNAPAPVKVAPKKPTAKASEKSSPKVSNLPVFKNVWMVQLGTFSNQSNAYKLRDRLRKDGFDGHTKDIVIDGKKAVRVFTGPFVNKQLASKIKKKVDKKYKVKSLVLFLDA